MVSGVTVLPFCTTISTIFGAAGSAGAAGAATSGFGNRPSSGELCAGAAGNPSDGAGVGVGSCARAAPHEKTTSARPARAIHVTGARPARAGIVRDPED